MSENPKMLKIYNGITDSRKTWVNPSLVSCVKSKDPGKGCSVYLNGVPAPVDSNIEAEDLVYLLTTGWAKE